MRRALAATRSSNLVEATRIIQEALKARRTPDPSNGSDARKAGSGQKSGGLAETLTQLRSGEKVPRLRRRLTPAELPGGEFLEREIQTYSGRRTYRLFVPAGTRPCGLIVMLHGCKQNAEDFAVGTTMNNVAAAAGMLVAYPTQSRAANPSGCWNWFRPEDQERSRGEPHIIAEMTRRIAGEYGLEGNIFVAGLSAGGAMAAVMGAAYPDLYEAIGIHSGVPYGIASDVNSAFAAMRGATGHGVDVPQNGEAEPRQIIFHGSRDRTVAPSNAAILMNRARTSDPTATASERIFTSGGMKVQLTELARGDGVAIAESWLVEGAGHHWIGGDPAGSFSKPGGPSAAREMMRFFLGKAPSP